MYLLRWRCFFRRINIINRININTTITTRISEGQLNSDDLSLLLGKSGVKISNAVFLRFTLLTAVNGKRFISFP